MALMAQDKKVKRGTLTFILVRGIGRAVDRKRCRSRATCATSSPKSSSQEIESADLSLIAVSRWTGSTDSRILIVLLCVLSAFFAGSETALTAASRASMLRLEKQGNRARRSSIAADRKRERLIGALLLGNNIANIAASALATGMLTLGSARSACSTPRRS